MQVAENQLSVSPVITSKEMADPEVDHLGVMANAAWFQHQRGHVKVERVPSPVPVVQAPPPPPPPPPVVEVPRRPPGEMLGISVSTTSTETRRPVSSEITRVPLSTEIVYFM